MKPLIFEFLEKRNEENYDFSMIGYDNNLNLNIDRKTGKPAINSLMLSTRTITNVCKEDSDSDKNDENLKILMYTQTRTVTDVYREDSDSDKNDGNIVFLMETMTKIATSKNSDRD